MLKEESQYDLQLQLEIWKGNVGGILDQAIESNSLTDSLLSISPLGMSLNHFHIRHVCQVM